MHEVFYQTLCSTTCTENRINLLSSSSRSLRHFQFFQLGELKNILGNNGFCTGATVMTPASAISHFEPSITFFNPMFRISLAIMSLASNIDPDLPDKRFNCH